jgi:hypothetical protein
MKVSDSGNGDFENPTAGSYGAVCYKLIDLGTQLGEYQGQKTSKRQLILGFELDENMSDGKPFVVSSFYTASLHEKARLRKDLAAWRGRDFTPEELQGFELQNLLGKPCMLSLAETDKGKIKIASIGKLPKGLNPHTQVNETVYFSLDPAEYNATIFDSFRDKMKALIMQSPEYQALHARPRAAAPAAAGGSFADMDDDIPFANPYRGRACYGV